MIPQETIDQIRLRTNIVEVVGQYVQLKKSGKNYLGLCPFHEEKTPSFTVAEDKQIFHCFGCGKGGNVFSFIQELEGVSFPESVKKVADIEQIPLDIEIETGSRKPSNPHLQPLFLIHQKAAELFHHILVHTKVGEEALNYLLQRGLSLELIEEFQIGYAPPQRDFLVEICKQDQISEEVLAASGLFIQRDNGSFSDRFHQRVMFPIRDPNGKTIAFSGRFLGDAKAAEQPKYLNSPETELFNKRKVLFNFDKARSTIRKEGTVYLCEGFMDVLAAWQAGIFNGIASMGTSLTEEQIQQIQRACSQLVIAYDGDNAGIEAAERAVELLSGNPRFELSVVSFPEKLDPDEYLRKYGAEALVELMQRGRQTVFAFKMRYHKLHRNLDNKKEQLDYLQMVMKDLAKVDSPIETDLYLGQLAEEFGLSRETLQNELRSLQAEQRQQLRQKRQQQVAVMPEKPQPLHYSLVEKAERMLIYRSMFEHHVRSRLLAEDIRFPHERYQELLLLLDSFLSLQPQFELADFLNYLQDDHMKQEVVGISLLNLSKDSTDQEISDLLKVLRQAGPAELIRQKQQEQHEARIAGNQQRELELTLEIVRLTKQMKQA